jgi:hypothetical protein
LLRSLKRIPCRNFAGKNFGEETFEGVFFFFTREFLAILQEGILGDVTEILPEKLRERMLQNMNF